jgi:hypothetical protein
MSDNTLLDALTCRGVLVAVSVRYWRARKKLNPEDLGLRRDRVDARFFSLGQKRLLPRDALKRFALLESRAHALVEENTFPFLNGVARYLPNTRLEEITASLRQLQAEFNAESAGFLSGYGTARADALREWRRAAEQLVDDPGRLLAVIDAAFPDAAAMPRYFGFEIRMFQVSVPDVPQADLVTLGTQREIVEARRQAAAEARTEMERSCRAFVADAVATMREQTAVLCGEMLATINGTGSVHQKTLNRLVNFIEQFKALNFAADTEMERYLDTAREKLLSRTAADYRDSDFARNQLVNGLGALRDRARELAAKDTGEVIAGFGQFGRRRFALAS